MPASTTFTSLISTQQLADHLAHPNWVVVDCRFDLAQPDWGFADYQKGHIPGAVYAHLDHDLAAPITPSTGRHPLPAPTQIAETLSKLGISNGSQVVVYDTVGGGFAARLWWMLRYCGHTAVAVLDGGYAKWLAESRPTQTGIDSYPRKDFAPSPQPHMLATTDQILQTLSSSQSVLIDARAPIRYRGEQEPIDPVAGRIPGALNRFHVNNLTPEGTFLPPTELSSEFETLLGGRSTADAIVYCGSGVTSCHHLVALASAGLPLPRLYVGSWSEWIRDPSRPVARGD